MRPDNDMLFNIIKNRVSSGKLSEDEQFEIVNFILDRKKNCNAEPIKKEIRGNDFVICQECGKPLKFISPSHLSKHGISRAEYLSRHGLQFKDCACEYVYLKIKSYWNNQNKAKA